MLTGHQVSGILKVRQNPGEDGDRATVFGASRDLRQFLAAGHLPERRSLWTRSKLLRQRSLQKR